LPAIAALVVSFALASCAPETLSLDRGTPPASEAAAKAADAETKADAEEESKPLSEKEIELQARTDLGASRAASAPPSGIEVERAPSLTAPGRDRETVKIGLLLPFSGPGSDVGRDMRDAALMALFDLSDGGIELLPRDTGGTAEGARQGAADLVQQGASLILGPLFRESVTSAAPEARDQGVPIIAFSSDRSVAGDGVYLLSFTPQSEVRRVVGYALANGLRRFAAVAPRNDYGDAVLNELEETLADWDGELIDVALYAPDGTGADESIKALALYEDRKRALEARRAELKRRGDAAAKRELRALKNADTLGDLDFDALLLPEGGATLRIVAPLLPYYDIDLHRIKLLGTGRWDTVDVGKEPSIVGGWFAGTDRQAIRDFRARFQGQFERAPVRLASLAYDAAALAITLGSFDIEPDYSPERLEDPNGYAGVDGIFRFLPDGSLERGLAVLEVKRGDYRMVDPAPESFEDLTN
jgi:hypothetical protein